MNRVAANVSSLIFGGDQSRLTSAATRRGSWSQCVRKREWALSMNRLVAQFGNLLFRRLAVGSGRGLPIRDTDCQSALPRHGKA
jgi:hypothetical protein